MPEQQEKEITPPFATMGARTRRSGWVAGVTTKLAYRGLMRARVGDIVQPLAVVGFRLVDGDRLCETLQNGISIDVRPVEPIPGLVDSTYVHHEQEHASEGHRHA